MGAFGSIVRCVTDGVYKRSLENLIHKKKENMLYELWENFYIEFHRISQQVIAYIMIFFGQVTNYINQCVRIRDFTVLAILIQINFKLIQNIDKISYFIEIALLPPQPLILF